MQERDAVGREDLAVAPSAPQAQGEVFGGVSGGKRFDGETAGEARIEGATSAEAETCFEIAEADEDEREQCLGVPFVIEEDMQMIERVLVKEVRLIEKEHRMKMVL
jgi:hypothetical protein